MTIVPRPRLLTEAGTRSPVASGSERYLRPCFGTTRRTRTTTPCEAELRVRKEEFAADVKVALVVRQAFASSGPTPLRDEPSMSGKTPQRRRPRQVPSSAKTWPSAAICSEPGTQPRGQRARKRQVAEVLGPGAKRALHSSNVARVPGHRGPVDVPHDGAPPGRGRDGSPERAVDVQDVLEHLHGGAASKLPSSTGSDVASASSNATFGCCWTAAHGDSGHGRLLSMPTTAPARQPRRAALDVEAGPPPTWRFRFPGGRRAPPGGRRRQRMSRVR